MLVVLVRSLTRCNLACGFCAHDRRLSGPRPQLDERRLERLIELLGDFRVRTDRPVLLSWLGGEPLLWRQRPQFDARARRHALQLSLTTNGFALERASVRAQLLTDYAELTVSVDAVPAVHDRLRGAPGLYARVLAGLRALLAERQRFGASLRVRINSVLMRSTIAGYADLVGRLLAEAPGIDEFTFNLLGGRDRPDFHLDEAVRASDWKSFVTALPVLHQQVTVRGARLAATDAYLARLRAQVDDRCWPVDDCAPGRHFLFVDESGRIAPCAFTVAEYGIPIDSLDDGLDLVVLPAQFHAARMARRAKVCGHCPSTQHAGKFGTVASAKGDAGTPRLRVAEENWA